MSAVPSQAFITDRDKLAWMDGMEVGFSFEYEGENCYVEVTRTPDGWQVLYFHNAAGDSERYPDCLEHKHATFAQVMDDIMAPPRFRAFVPRDTDPTEADLYHITRG